jgi:hypothetical protein
LRKIKWRRGRKSIKLDSSPGIDPAHFFSLRGIAMTEASFCAARCDWPRDPANTLFSRNEERTDR